MAMLLFCTISLLDCSFNVPFALLATLALSTPLVIFPPTTMLLPIRFRLVSVCSQLNAPVLNVPALTLPTFTVGAFTASMMACVICNVPAPPEKPTLVLAVRGAKVTVPVVWAEKLASESVSALKVILPVSDALPMALLPEARKIS